MRPEHCRTDGSRPRTSSRAIGTETVQSYTHQGWKGYVRNSCLLTPIYENFFDSNSSFWKSQYQNEQLFQSHNNDQVCPIDKPRPFFWKCTMVIQKLIMILKWTLLPDLNTCLCVRRAWLNIFDSLWKHDVNFKYIIAADRKPFTVDGPCIILETSMIAS